VRRDEQNHRQRLGRQRLEHLEAVALGHLHVEEHQVGQLACDQRERRLAVAALARDHDVAFRPQQPPDPPARRGLVVHDERAQRHPRLGMQTTTRVPWPRSCVSSSDAASP
jgi:hypothetical protein